MAVLAVAITAVAVVALLPDPEPTLVQVGETDCVRLFAEGSKTKIAKFHVPCHHETLGAHVPDLTELPCADGRELVWSDQGWGYVDEPWHRHAEGAPEKAPAAEIAACEG